MQNITSYIFRKAGYVFPLLYVLTRVLFQPSVWGDNVLVAAMASWGEPSPYLIYPSYLLGMIIAALRSVIPQIEWFNVFLFAANLCCIFIWSHCFVSEKNGKPGLKNIVAACCVLLFFLISIKFPYYSNTCCVGIASGLAWMLYAQQTKKWVEYVAGALFLFFSACIRYDGCISLIAFAGALGCYFLLKRNIRYMPATFVAIAIVCLVNVVQSQFCHFKPWEPGENYPEQNSVVINDVRMAFYDYDDWRDDEKTKEYEEAGLTENDKKILSVSCYQLEKRSEPGWFEKLGEIRRRNNEKLPRSFSLLAHRFRQGWERNHWGGITIMSGFCVPDCCCSLGPESG